MVVESRVENIPEKVSKFLEELRKEFKDKILSVKILAPTRAEVKIARNSHKQIIKWLRDRFAESSYLVTINTVDYIDRGDFELQYEIQLLSLIHISEPTRPY